jgi:hypothetical protein
MESEMSPTAQPLLCVCVCVWVAGKEERGEIARLYRPVATALILYSAQSGRRMYETPTTL